MPHNKLSNIHQNIINISHENKRIIRHRNYEFMYLAIGTYGASYHLGENPKVYHDYGKYMTIWKEKPDGSLVIAYSMTNTDIQ